MEGRSLPELPKNLRTIAHGRWDGGRMCIVRAIGYHHGTMLPDEDPLPDVAESLVLVRQARAGDRSAVNDLIARYQDRVHRIVRIRMGRDLRPGVDSMDIVQETFQRAVPKLEDFEPQGHGAILQWLAAIATHQIHDQRKYQYAAKRDRANEVRPSPHSDAPGIENEPADVTLPPERVARQELKRALDEAIAELPEAEREVIVLRKLCGLTWEETQAQLGLGSVGATRHLYNAARLKLSRKLEPPE
jgi:RNA polymerase sigma-70 factor (ECF subfamily)